ncbi:hypothetical protein Taro_055967 [Colocasia esculenta]|uniref:Uncharacterized protein n=1 Tax=Colocasia esculenta TaxID=4460 RepID=A0A843XSA5_COLES|nr:hypothetical protein [Colocasia esculenta]
MSSTSPVESSSLEESKSQGNPAPTKSKHHPRKQQGKVIPQRYLQELARRCQALLLIEEFTREVLVLEEEFVQDGVFMDDGFGVYEIMNDEDPIDEEDSEVDAAAEKYASGVRRFDEPIAAGQSFITRVVSTHPMMVSTQCSKP